MFIMIDNYDSFVYNLSAYFQELGQDIKVIRNDKVTINELKKIEDLSGIIISPGPGNPKDGGISEEVIKYFFSFLYFKDNSCTSIVDIF